MPSEADRPPAPTTPGPIPTAPAPSGPGFFDTVVTWLVANWFYAISALSLALAGISVAQYAAEHGLLEPPTRVALAALFGIALIAAGEVIRRRSGDETDVATAYLPSVFTGAGVVTLFGAVLTARALYGLIGVGPALIGFVAIAALSVALGWFYGPLLAAIGMIGASAAPFLVGGDPGAPYLLHSYFGAVALAGLAVNALQRWRWIDALSLFLPFGAAFLVLEGTGGGVAFVVLSVVLCVASNLFVGSASRAKAGGSAILVAVTRRSTTDIAAQTALLASFWLVAALAMLVAVNEGTMTALAASGAFTVLFVVSAVWSRGAPAMLDLPVIAGLGLFAFALLRAPSDFALASEARLNDLAWSLKALTAGSIVMSIVAARRSAGETGRAAAAWAMGAALLAPGMLVLLEVLWAPGALVGGAVWASTIMAIAAAATLAAERAARIDQEDRFRASLGVLVALSMIALAFFVLLTKAALSLALAVLVLGAVALDERFRLPHLAVFIQAGVGGLVYRSIVDPGIIWGMDAQWFDAVIAYGVPALALATAWLLGRGRKRLVSTSVIEGGFAVVAGTGLSIAIARIVAELSERGQELTHWSVGLMCVVWIIAGTASFRSANTQDEQRGEALPARVARIVRRTTSIASFVVAGGAILALLTVLNPLFNRSEEILGPVGISSLVLAYLLPGLVLIVGVRTVPRLSARARGGGMTLGGILATLYVCLSIAQAWRGPRLEGVPMGDGELWSYTVLLLLTGGGLFLASIRAESSIPRYGANVLLLIAIGKVFVVDAMSLTGLARAGSFLLLGLLLAGLAWVNRRASMLATENDPEPD